MSKAYTTVGSVSPKSASAASSTSTSASKSEAVYCCQIIIVEVKGEADVRREGKLISASKGQVLQEGDEIYTGKDSQVTVAFIDCGYGNGSTDVGIALVQNGSMGKIINKDGKPAVFHDPGVAQVSVKQLQQFQTDFQVSTPRLVCSVRG